VRKGQSEEGREGGGMREVRVGSCSCVVDVVETESSLLLGGLVF